MNPIIWFAIIGVSALIVLLPNAICQKMMRKHFQTQFVLEKFRVSEYLAHIEQTNIEIAEKIDPVEKAIVLWWGLDGLRLNEDGSLEWISRRKPNPVNQSVFYQPCQSIQIQMGMPLYNDTQSTMEQIDALMERNMMLKLQAAMDAQRAIEQCCCDWNHLYGRKL